MFVNPARCFGGVVVVSVQAVNCLKIQRDVLVASSLCQFKLEVVLLFQKPKTFFLLLCISRDHA